MIKTLICDSDKTAPASPPKQNYFYQPTTKTCQLTTAAWFRDLLFCDQLHPYDKATGV